MLSDAPLAAATQAIEEVRNGTPEPAPMPRWRAKPPLWRWVEFKDEAAGGRAEMLMNPPNGLLIDMGTSPALGVRRLHEVIRAWNLDDADGQPLPVSRESLDSLEPEVIRAIIDAWNDARGLSKRH